MAEPTPPVQHPYDPGQPTVAASAYLRGRGVRAQITDDGRGRLTASIAVQGCGSDLAIYAPPDELIRALEGACAALREDLQIRAARRALTETSA